MRAATNIANSASLSLLLEARTVPAGEEEGRISRAPYEEGFALAPCGISPWLLT